MFRVSPFAFCVFNFAFSVSLFTFCVWRFAFHVLCSRFAFRVLHFALCLRFAFCVLCVLRFVLAFSFPIILSGVLVVKCCFRSLLSQDATSSRTFFVQQKHFYSPIMLALKQVLTFLVARARCSPPRFPCDARWVPP